MPDNPGDIFCDLAYLAGPGILAGFYDNYDRDRTHQRLARYQDLLALR